MPFHHVYAEADEALLTGTLGTFLPGHFMLVTREHLNSFAYLSASQLVRTEQFLDVLLGKLGSVFGRYVAFEHGSASSDQLVRRSCVVHAHIHLLPIYDLLQNRLTSQLLWKHLPFLADLHDFRGRQYFLLRQLQGWSIANDVDLPSQWIRQQAGDALGDDRWDWATYPGHDEFRTQNERLAENVQQLNEHSMVEFVLPSGF